MTQPKSNPLGSIKIVERVPQHEAFFFKDSLTSARKTIAWLETKSIRAFWEPDKVVDGREISGNVIIELFDGVGSESRRLMTLRPDSWIVWKGFGHSRDKITFYDEESFDATFRPAKKSD